MHYFYNCTVLRADRDVPVSMSAVPAFQKRPDTFMLDLRHALEAHFFYGLQGVLIDKIRQGSKRRVLKST